MFNLNQAALNIGGNYFPQIKKLTEEREKEKLKKWAKELCLKGQHLKKIDQYEKAIIKIKKRIPPKVVMAISLYKYMEHQKKESEKELQTVFGTGYAGFTGQYVLNERNENIQHLTQKEEKEEFVVEEGITLSFEDNFVDFVVESEQETVSIENTKQEYKEAFKKVIKEKKESEKIKQMDKENPFVDDESIFSEFDAHYLKNKKEKNKEAIAKLEKLFAS